jgi:hypothetical protein
VKGDTGNILGQAGDANQTAACIDQKLMGQSGSDGDCGGQPDAQAPEPSTKVSDDANLSRKAFEGLVDEAPPPPGQPEREATKATPEPERRERASVPEVPELPDLPELETLTPRQVDDLVDELLPGLLGRNRDPDERPPRDVLERLLPELPLLGR